MVSVIIPVYNVEEYLDQCLQSVTTQTYNDIEILILDDGSTDRSGVLCSAWAQKDPRIIYIHKTNEGQGPTRNLGVQMAHGETLAFVDPDDWWESTFLSEMLDAMGDAEMVFCDYKIFTQEKTLTARRYSWLSGYTTLVKTPQLLYTMGAATWNKLYRRELWLRSGIQQPAKAYEDVSAMTKLWLTARSIAQLRRPLYNYRVDRPASTTNLPDKMPEMLEAITAVSNTLSLADQPIIEQSYPAKYSAMVLAVPLSRLPDSERIQRAQATDFYYACFPFARAFDAQSLVVLGGEHGSYALAKTFFLRTQVDMVPLESTALQAWSAAGFCGTAIIDLASCPDSDISALTEALQQTGCRPILLKSFWTYGHGLYDATQPFEAASEIMQANANLEKSCRSLTEVFPQMPVVECEDFAFTDPENPLGCRPPFRNNYFYYCVADQLRRILGESL